MADSKATDEWPSRTNTIAPAAQLLALGQITLVYNYLEESIGNIFKKVMPTDASFSEKFYHRLNNRDRINLLNAIIQQSTLEADIKEALLYLLNSYHICTENRNVLLHAILESADADILNISKKAARDPGRDIQFRIPLADMRLVADQMGDAFVYAMRIQTTISARSNPPQVSSVGLFPVASTLPDVLKSLESLPPKPPKPHKLVPYQPPEPANDEEFPPQSSNL
jgi:hypothetical protein